MALLRIAFRNLLRAKRRNILSGGTMVLGSAALVLGSGLSDGIARQLTASLVATQTGHIQVVVRPNDFQPQNSPFDVYGQDFFLGAEDLARSLETGSAALGVDVVKAVPYVYARGTAMAGSRSTLASIIGVDPEREPELQRSLPPASGRFLPAGDLTAVYIAAPMARKLRLATGDAVSFVVQTPEGALNSLDMIVCGVFKKAAPWFDGAFYVSLPAAQSLFDQPGGATNLKILLRDGGMRSAHRTQPILARLVAEAAPRKLAKGTALQVESFDKAGRFAFAIIQANETALFILSCFLFSASAVGIVNAMLMSVHERTREIGTVRALGMRRRLVVRMFVLEGFALGSVAALVGVTIGGAMVLRLALSGIAMKTMTLAWMAGGDTLFPVLEPWSVARAALAITAISTLAAIYPAYAASRLQPREALHHI